MFQEKRKRDRSADASEEEAEEPAATEAQVEVAPPPAKRASVREVVKVEGVSSALSQTLDYLHKTLQRY